MRVTGASRLEAAHPHGLDDAAVGEQEHDEERQDDRILDKVRPSI